IAEMRNPVPLLESPPEGGEDLEAFFNELLASGNTGERLTGLYAVTMPALRDAYRAHLDGCNPLVDHPTARMIRGLLSEMDDAIRWGRTALQVVGVDKKWLTHLTELLTKGRSRQKPRNTRPDFWPRRDERFSGQHNFEFAPHVVYNMPEATPEE